MTQTIDVASPIETVSTVPAQAEGRLSGIDRTRGLVILLMALDHVRDFFDADSLRFFPTDLSRTYPALFLTRFVTHYCAPTFVLLAGASAFLHGSKLESKGALSRFLLTRGAWLILLDVVVIGPIWGGGLGKVELGVLWAIGAGMIALSGLVWLPELAVLLIGALIVCGHDLLDDIHASRFGEWGPFWSLLHEPGPLPWGVPGMALYPALPWIGVMAVGYGLGRLFAGPAARRERQLTGLGLVSIALFLVLRATNFYGDPRPWVAQGDLVMTALSVLNVSKYPPSLLYALVTLGPVFLLLPAMERLGGAAGEVLATFGRVPLFVYVLHLYVALAAAGALFLAQGFSLRQLRDFAANHTPPDGLGLHLPGVYVAWIVIMAALYPAARWFAGVKRRRRDWWLSYL